VSFEIVVFYLFSAIVVFSAFRVITVNNPVFAAMFLVLTFFTCAAIWMLLEAEFLAITLVQRYFRNESYPPPERVGADYSNTEELGRVLYSDYLFQFEIAAIILLVAIVAAIALTLRRRPETKYQRPAQQIDIDKADRVRVVSMPPSTLAGAPASGPSGTQGDQS